MFCPRCGRNLVGDEKFCPECGNVLYEATAEQTHEPTTDKTMSGNAGYLLLFLVGFAVMFFITYIVGFVFFFFFIPILFFSGSRSRSGMLFLGLMLGSVVGIIMKTCL